MVQNRCSVSVKEEWGHSKRNIRLKQNTAQQTKHQILQLHIRHLGLIMESLGSRGLGLSCLSSSAASNTNSLSFEPFYSAYSFPQSMSCGSVISSILGSLLQPMLYLHSFTHWPLGASLLCLCCGRTPPHTHGLSGSLDPRCKTQWVSYHSCLQNQHHFDNTQILLLSWDGAWPLGPYIVAFDLECQPWENTFLHDGFWLGNPSVVFSV